MNEVKITSEFIQTPIGFTIAKSDLTTGKVVINNIEITSIEDWDKVTHSIVELQQENARLKDKNKKALELLQILHYNFPDYDDMHEKIEDIEKILKEN